MRKSIICMRWIVPFRDTKQFFYKTSKIFKISQIIYCAGHRKCQHIPHTHLDRSARHEQCHALPGLPERQCGIPEFPPTDRRRTGWGVFSLPEYRREICHSRTDLRSFRTGPSQSGRLEKLRAPLQKRSLSGSGRADRVLRHKSARIRLSGNWRPRKDCRLRSRASPRGNGKMRPDRI